MPERRPSRRPNQPLPPDLLEPDLLGLAPWDLVSGTGGLASVGGGWVPGAWLWSKGALGGRGGCSWPGMLAVLLGMEGGADWRLRLGALMLDIMPAGRGSGVVR